MEETATAVTVVEDPTVATTTGTTMAKAALVVTTMDTIVDITMDTTMAKAALGANATTI